MKIIENQNKYLSEFIRLNEEWISTYFELEELDRSLAKNPQKIIDDGGYIFTLLLNDHVIGVCALFNEGNGVFELARMAVSPKYQGNGYGNTLIKSCLLKLSEISAKRVHLVSNTKLKTAINLYKKHGFKTILLGQHPMYSRANITMGKNIEPMGL